MEIVSLEAIKAELRINPSVTDHDDLLKAQIEAAVVFVEREISGSIDPENKALGQAVILLVRQFYDGYREIRPTEAFYALIQPWRRYD